MSDSPRITPATVRSLVARSIWDVEMASLPPWKVRLIKVARLIYAVIRDLVDGQISLRAMSLVYTTLLSLVPLLAISFSVLKAFGVHNQVEPLLLNFLEPMGEKGVEITEQVIGFVENVQAGVLGVVGLGLLIYTVVSLLQKVERAFNTIWHVSHERPFARRFSEYLSVIIIGPVLVFSALGITASVMSATVVQEIAAIQPFGALLNAAARLVPYGLIATAFTFIYIFMPNTKVRLRSAFVGALVAGILWETTGWAFASFVVGSAKYTAIYAAFATLIVFMIWLYLSWLILMVGANIAFYHQHPEYLATERGTMKLSSRMKEKIALLITFLVGGSYYHGRPAWSAEGLAERLRVPVDAAQSVIQALELRGLLKRTSDEPPSYLPARPPETTAVKDVLDAVREAGEEAPLNLERLPSESAVEELMDRLDQALAEAFAGRTLKDLAVAEEAPVARPFERPAEPTASGRRGTT
jgi:membrane protein